MSMEEMHPVVLEIADSVDQCKVKKANLLLDNYAQSAVVSSCTPLWKQLAERDAELATLRTQLAEVREELHCIIENVAEALMPDSPKECREAEFYFDGMGACQIIRRKAAQLAAAQSDAADLRKATQDFWDWHVQSDPTMESANWHVRNGRGARIHESLAAIHALLTPASPMRTMYGPSDAHPDSEHFGEHLETPHCLKGRPEIHCSPFAPASPKGAAPGQADEGVAK